MSVSPPTARANSWVCSNIGNLISAKPKVPKTLCAVCSTRFQRAESGGRISLTPLIAWNFPLSATERLSSGLSGFGLVRLGVLDVAIGVSLDAGLILRRERAAEFSRMAHEEAARRHDRALGHQRTRRHDRVFADARAVQQDGAHAEQDARFNRTAVQDRAVPDGYRVR